MAVANSARSISGTISNVNASKSCEKALSSPYMLLRLINIHFLCHNYSRIRKETHRIINLSDEWSSLSHFTFGLSCLIFYNHISAFVISVPLRMSVDLHFELSSLFNLFSHSAVHYYGYLGLLLFFLGFFVFLIYCVPYFYLACTPPPPGVNSKLLCNQIHKSKLLIQ